MSFLFSPGKGSRFCGFFVLLFSGHAVFGQLDPALADLPLLTIDDVKFEGAFRISASANGNSEMNYSEGPFYFRPDKKSIIIVGHSHQMSVAEYPVPELVQSQTVTDLNMAQNPIQVFTDVLGKSGLSNGQEINTIGGMAVFEGPNGQELIINAYEYYDAPADNSSTSLVIRNADDISGSAADGYFGFAGRASTARWLSPIPGEWRETLGGPWITGSSSGDPIISRWPVGPTAFVFDPGDIVGNSSISSPVSTTALLDFSLDNVMGNVEDLSASGTMWNHLSRAVYGFIVPGTRTYFTIGTSGGHESGVCYKCRGCGGYCSSDPDDNGRQWYWLFDMEDLVKVKNGTLAPHEVAPYEYGVFPGAFGNNGTIGGGSFDPESGLLYISLPGADRDQGEFANPPVIVAYRFENSVSGVDDREGRRFTRDPGASYTLYVSGPFRQQGEIYLDVAETQKVKAAFYDIRGRLVREIFKGKIQSGVPVRIPYRKVEQLSGTFILKIRGEHFQVDRFLPVIH